VIKTHWILDKTNTEFLSDEKNHYQAKYINFANAVFKILFLKAEFMGRSHMKCLIHLAFFFFFNPGSPYVTQVGLQLEILFP
jgi:hypothetical protein